MTDYTQSYQPVQRKHPILEGIGKAVAVAATGVAFTWIYMGMDDRLNAPQKNLNALIDNARVEQTYHSGALPVDRELLAELNRSGRNTNAVNERETINRMRSYVNAHNAPATNPLVNPKYRGVYNTPDLDGQPNLKEVTE